MHAPHSLPLRSEARRVMIAFFTDPCLLTVSYYSVLAGISPCHLPWSGGQRLQAQRLGSGGLSTTPETRGSGGQEGERKETR